MRHSEARLIALDCRELAKPKASALAQVLTSLMKHNPHHRYLLLSDRPLNPSLIPSGARNVAWGRDSGTGLGVVRYQHWLRDTADRLGAEFLYEVDHYALFRSRVAKRITTIHDLYVLEGLEPLSLMRRLAYRVFTMLTLRNSDVVTVVSQFTLGRLAHFFKLKRSVLVLGVGIEKPSEVPVPVEGLDGPFVLSLGRISSWKCSVELASLFAKYFSGSGYSLIFAGRCDAREAAVGDQLLAISARTPSVKWLDFVSDGEREWLLQNTRLLCYPSRYDGFGMPPLEAAIRRTPCLMSDLPVLREVTRGKGIYIDFFADEDETARQIAQLLNCTPSGTQLDELERVATSHTWEGFFDAAIAEVGKQVPASRSWSTRGHR